jgi:tRNA(adenine34) deaminase
MGYDPIMRHLDYMKLAIAEAYKAERAGDVPVGAVLVCEQRVIAVGFNTREALHDPTGHAEINVLREGARALQRWRLTGCTLYVTLEPCPMCAAAMAQCRLERLVFGAQDPRMGAAGTCWNLVEEPRLRHRVEVVAGVLEAACADQLRQFFRGQRPTS